MVRQETTRHEELYQEQSLRSLNSYIATTLFILGPCVVPLKLQVFSEVEKSKEYSHKVQYVSQPVYIAFCDFTLLNSLV